MRRSFKKPRSAKARRAPRAPINSCSTVDHKRPDPCRHRSSGIPRRAARAHPGTTPRTGAQATRRGQALPGLQREVPVTSDRQVKIDLQQTGVSGWAGRWQLASSTCSAVITKRPGRTSTCTASQARLARRRLGRADRRASTGVDWDSCRGQTTNLDSDLELGVHGCVARVTRLNEIRLQAGTAKLSRWSRSMSRWRRGPGCGRPPNASPTTAPVEIAAKGHPSTVIQGVHGLSSHGEPTPYPCRAQHGGGRDPAAR